MGNLSNILGGPWSPPPERKPDPPEIQLQQAIADAGLTPPDQVVIDGALHRFNSGTSGRGNASSKPGWYIAFPDGVPAGRFGCWRADIDQTWRADIGRDLSAAEEMAISRRNSEARSERDRQRKLVHETVAEVVGKIWTDGAPASTEHPYIHRKGIHPHGARITGDGRLMVPMLDADRQIVGLQYISSDGQKRYHPSSKAGGAHWCIGEQTERTLIAEGYATAATLHEVTGDQAVVAFSASNLPRIAEMLREQRGPNHRLVIVADHDESGVGRAHADQASAKTGALVVMPPEPGMDANDYHLAGHDLHALLEPPQQQDWLVPADEWAQQPAPISWLVKHWLQSDALMMVHGPSGGGKTFAVLDWCLRIALAGAEGMDWRGHKVRQGPAVYLAGEGHHGLRARIAAWKHYHQAGDLRMWISRSGCDLNTPEGYQYALSALRSLSEPPKLIVVDTLHRFLNGDENSAQDAKTMLDACAGLMREFNCSALLVHHTGVSDEAQHRARGSSAWRGALDIEVSVVPPKNDSNAIEIVQRKSKDAELAESVWCRLESVAIPGWYDEDGEPVTSAVMVEEEAPPKPQKESKLAINIKRFTSAWYESPEWREGAPYLSRSALKQKLKNVAEEKRPSDRTIQNELSASYPDKLIGSLILGEIIEPYEHGWIVIDKVLAGNMEMADKERKKTPPPKPP